MGTQRFRHWFTLLIALCSPLWLCAQFQEPAKDELQMTSDPKAPGASAVYLYREDITDQTKSTRTYYERIKILTEQGKELGTARLTYEPESEKIVSVEGRTIHPDGTIVPLAEKPSVLVEVKTKGFQVNTLVVTLPGIEVGSIVEYRIRVKYSPAAPTPNWIIQQSHFVHKAHYLFRTFNARSVPGWASRMPVAAKIVTDNQGLYTLDIDDVPALPDEDWMPPLNTVKWRVSFFYSDYKDKDEYWKEIGKTWGTFVYNLVNPTGGLKRAAAEIVAPGDTQTQKAQKIYTAVMNLENTTYTREKTKAERKKEKIKDINTIEDVWKQKRGSSDEIALLYVALCRAAGLNVDPMVVADRSRAMFDDGLLSYMQLDGGIGTTAPLRALTVQGEASIVPSPANGTSAYLNVSDGTGSNGGNHSLNIRGLGNDGTAGVNLASVNVLADNFLVAGVAGPKMSVDSNGNVTIYGNLTVKGTIA
jgi:Domain of Unknown Function with PDB structure (DUF3857)/Transglutaminase-like superfamily